jgi:hypothetical protein
MKKRLSRVDKEACERAIEITRNSSDDRRKQIDELLAEEGWSAAADLAVYHCQRSLIAPRLWQPLPADIDPAQVDAIIAKGDDHLGGEFQAAKLLRRLLKAGLSRYEPRPIEALAKVKAQRMAAKDPLPEPEPAA